ncbi:hypothetical protein SNOG_00092 [Parastagonospora nodorum SN15]|uniref:CDC20/Fizzy WD40 domain-containing protein n=1 Tax=Phaeosphaeria nodorum (strain SN15 / ATCC MYA-4574 / FGSC 10173) TaxID=321614 RepID=Q0V7C2_PHANO|nr:hypothetical protein SNOG_00092 [Parastagonospora nodorum SN15]EAT91587.2 hypothetical protein SNOG_00092 [Parastagonospora nodorum SN15]
MRAAHAHDNIVAIYLYRCARSLPLVPVPVCAQLEHALHPQDSLPTLLAAIVVIVFVVPTTIDMAPGEVDAGDDRVATPTLISPPESKTPPTAHHKRTQSLGTVAHDRNSEPVDGSILTKALEQLEHAGRPSVLTRKHAANSIPDSFQIVPVKIFKPASIFSTKMHHQQPLQELGARLTTSCTSKRCEYAKIRALTYSPNKVCSIITAPFRNPINPSQEPLFLLWPANTIADTVKSAWRAQLECTLRALQPITNKVQQSTHAAQSATSTSGRFQDDFYLNLVDWGSQNILGVGLGSCVYMWNSSSGRVTKLCELGDDSVTSVNWIQRGSHIAIGTNRGQVQIWDAQTQRRLRTMMGHTARVGALAWNEHILTSGSRDRTIYHRDVRQPDQWLRKLVGHKQEICGLKWNHEDQQLASGGNDNKLMVWDKLNDEPTYKFSEHQAAVKAIAWSPHQRGLLASGGGTADRTIKFWNTLISSSGPSASSLAAASVAASASATSNIPIPPTAPANLISSLDTGSQVCNLAWSKNSNEIVSTHGYSQNQIIVWKYPSMQQVVSLTGHTYRVLYLAMSPDGQVIVTGAGDETLRFWNAFKKKERTGGLSSMDSWGVIR